MGEHDNFFCCGGNDENPPEHTQDCEEYGNLKWFVRMNDQLDIELAKSQERVAELEKKLEANNKELGFTIKSHLDDIRKVQKLESKLAKAVEALDLAVDLLRVPEHMQDSEWYEKEEQVKKTLAEVEG